MTIGLFQWSYEKEDNVFGGAGHDGNYDALDQTEDAQRSVYPPL